jgi:DNA-binding NarL/FixJ family response regulator
VSEEEKRSVKVLLVDDQELVRTGLRGILRARFGFEIVGELESGAGVVEAVAELEPDVVVMDVRMPGTNGLIATETICADTDLAGTRVLILTTFENDEHVARALRAGASGFLGKYVTTDALLEAIRTVAAGESLLSPGATKALIAQFLATPPPGPAAPLPTAPGIRDLTNREREAMMLAADGKSNDEIAGELHLSVLTVRTHIQRAMNKLGARDRAQLVVLAYKNGLVPPDPGST